MKNLAGDTHCDLKIKEELSGCGIDLVESGRVNSEVPYTITGKLGPYTFTRAWYYWVVNGPTPIEVARELYNDIVGGGHCGCPSPDEYGCDFYDLDGKHLYVDIDGKERERCLSFLEKGFLTKKEFDSWHFISSQAEKKELAVVGIIDSYHIDTEIGLKVFVDTIKKHGLDKRSNDITYNSV
jgi:hypothetical protein